MTQPYPDLCLSLSTVFYLTPVDAQRGGTWAVPFSSQDSQRRNPRGPAIARATNPGVVILDEGFQCASFPGAERLKLRTMHALQKALLPSGSVLLAPGEAWDVSR